MTLPRLDDLTQYWKDNPPIHISVSAVLTGLAGKGKSKGRGKGGPPPMPHIPLDKNGNPTQDIPMNIEAAAEGFGGGVIRPKRRRE